MEKKQVHGLGKDEEEEEESLPGFRFHPTDEELVRFYLRRKVEKRPLSIELIKQIDIYKYDPWDLPKMGNVGDKEWYFYCLRGRKYKNSIRPNRVTGHGFWKATGIDRQIYSQGERNNECIGLKKSLVYYRGSAGKGTKTDWMMHEFRLPTEDAGKSTNVTNLLENTQEVEVWTICRIFKRIASYNKYVPELSDSSLSKLKRNTTELSSITYSSDSDARHEQYNHVQGAKMEYMGGKSFHHVEEQNKPLIRSQLWSLGQASLTTSYSSYPTPNAGTFQRNENWDELGAVVEFALDPSTVHGCSHSL